MPDGRQGSSHIAFAYAIDPQLAYLGMHMHRKGGQKRRGGLIGPAGSLRVVAGLCSILEGRRRIAILITGRNRILLLLGHLAQLAGPVPSFCQPMGGERA